MKKLILSVVVVVVALFAFEALAETKNIVPDISFGSKTAIVAVGIWVIWWHFDIYRLYRKIRKDDRSEERARLGS